MSHSHEITQDKLNEMFARLDLREARAEAAAAILSTLADDAERDLINARQQRESYLRALREEEYAHLAVPPRYEVERTTENEMEDIGLAIERLLDRSLRRA